METIRLNNLVPHVFAQSGDLGSAVWQRDVTFHKGHLYLVEAESGKGKSTFCSYLLGYRHDYSGELYFDDRLASRLQRPCHRALTIFALHAIEADQV